MRVRRSRFFVVGLGLALIGLACGPDVVGPDGSAPPPSPASGSARISPRSDPIAARGRPSAPTILTLDPAAPALESAQVSFYAKRGERRTGALYFRNAAGGRGAEYMRLEVGPTSLLARPGGAPIGPGDSVLITIRVPDPSRVNFELSPSGLQFDRRAPATLRVSYVHADHDFDQDGDVDVFDFFCELGLSVWRQELLGLPFLRIPSALDLLADRVSADLSGFSQYAVAY